MCVYSQHIVYLCNIGDIEAQYATKNLDASYISARFAMQRVILIGEYCTLHAQTSDLPLKTNLLNGDRKVKGKKAKKTKQKQSILWATDKSTSARD